MAEVVQVMIDEARRGANPGRAPQDAPMFAKVVL